MTNAREVTRAMTTPATLALVAVVWAAVAALWDLLTRRIPNYLTVPAALLGLALNLVLGGLAGLARSGLGLLTGLALLLVPFAMGGMGAGDVKMLAAIGALGGPSFAFRAFLFGSIAGGLIALALILLRAKKPGRDQAFPYGVAILAGTVAAYATALVR